MNKADLGSLFGSARQPLFLAPMYGITHCAFRRLIADFGSCDILCTEMLPARQILAKVPAQSPYLRSRPTDGRTVYQLLLSGDEDISGLVERLRPFAPWGLDLNAGCPAPAVRRFRTGFELFRDSARLRDTLRRLRSAWDGPLSVKCRLGDDAGDWQDRFADALKIFSDEGVDYLVLHPRFAGEKLKRPARWESVEWVRSRTGLPVVLNGDLVSSDVPGGRPDPVGLASGLMIGRMAICRPWVFREFRGLGTEVDYAEVWTRLAGYATEDFPPTEAVKRMRDFTAYYSRNFIHSHHFFTRVSTATGLAGMTERALEFLSSAPPLCLQPSFSGI